MRVRCGGSVGESVSLGSFIFDLAVLIYKPFRNRHGGQTNDLGN